MPQIKTVFHVHTSYSDDTNTSLEDLLESARTTGVGCVAVTDHDAIEGARELAATAPAELTVIIGEEVSTSEGHLIGLFLRDLIEPGMSARETAKAIRRQQGLVVVPHPFNQMFGCSLQGAVYDIIDLIDIVEISNAQNLSPFPNNKAARFAQQHRFPGLVGADTHHRGYLDSCYQLLKPFEGPQEFLATLRSARFVAGRHPLSYFCRTAYLIARYRLGLGLPAGYGANAMADRPGTSRNTVSTSGD